MIIDCHCHAGKGDKMTAPWNTDAPVEAYLRRARAAGIDKTIVLAPMHGNYQIANTQVARIVARYPSRLIGFAFVHTKRDAGRIFQMVKQAVTRWGFRGIKVHGFEGMPTREVCETARAFRLPILVDIISRPEVVDMFAPEYPDVNFIIAHLGSFTDDWKAHQQVTYQLARYPNVYADTSGVRQFRYLIEAIKRGGPHKLLFGSDGPWLHPGVEIHKIRLLGLAPDEEKLVLGGNILRLLRKTRAGQSALEVEKIKKYHADSSALHLRGAEVSDQTLEESEAQSEQSTGESLYRL
ncbi:MAG TPA: amidohydrolase family protein [Candidatus Angelobacter sp.]|nr:amidohydrolase family protein [Candidatus Angelobacter sp.]